MKLIAIDEHKNIYIDPNDVESVVIITPDRPTNCIAVTMKSGENHFLNMRYGFSVYGTHAKVIEEINSARD